MFRRKLRPGSALILPLDRLAVETRSVVVHGQRQWVPRETVGLDKHATLGGVQFLDDGLGATTLGGEKDFDGRRGCCCLWRTAVGLLAADKAVDEDQDQNRAIASHGNPLL